MATKSPVLQPAPEVAVKEAKEKVAADSLATMTIKEPAQTVHYSILQVGDYIQNRLGRLLREHELTLSQYQIMRVLDQAATPLPSLVVAQAMLQPAPGITGLLTRMEAQGLVRRKQDKQDKRVTQVDLAPKARALLKKLEKPVLNLHKELASSLNDAELKQLAKLLEKAWAGMQGSSQPE